MTRADKLRSMTDGQLVDLIFDFGVDEQLEFCPDLPECKDGNATAEDCKGCMLKWLRSPAEGTEEGEAMDIQKAISILERDNELMLFEPMTGAVTEYEALNGMNKESYDAHVAAISAMQELQQCKEQELLLKPGDVVYVWYSGDGTIEAKEISSITLGKQNDAIEFTDFSCFTIWEKDYGEYFGKCIFLTKEDAEDAEQALEGRRRAWKERCKDEKINNKK